MRTVAAHEVVAAIHPRPVSERDELGMAIGKAIDTALGRYSHGAGRGGSPGVARTVADGMREFDELCREADLRPTLEVRAGVEQEVTGVVRAFRGSVLFGLERPRSRMILIDESMGIYTQPDYWDRSRSFYEMKSYRAIPPPPDVALQMALFQLGFPGLRAFLIAFDRHSRPVAVKIEEVAPLTEEERVRTLRNAREVASRLGKEKILEYVESPVVRYSLRDVPSAPAERR